MLIREMTGRECLKVLEHARIGRLACARDNQPYIVPVFFTYHDERLYGGHLYGRRLYGFTTLGQKIEWMRENPLVCVETDEVKSHNEWLSIIITGRYEELPDTPEYDGARLIAHELLQQHAMWWQPAYTATVHRDPTQPLTPIFYRILISEMTGHRATPEEIETPAPASEGKERGWLHGILRREKDKR